MDKYIITLWKYTGYLWFWVYSNNRIAITFNDIETNERIDVLTTNLVDTTCDNNHIFLNINNNLWLPIDNDILDIFLKEWLITNVVDEYNSWFVSYPKCKISDKLKQIINIQEL